MGFFDFFRPKWKNSDHRVRMQAARTVDDPAVLKTIAESDENTEVRIEAIKNIQDQKTLAHFLENDLDPRINTAVEERLSAFETSRKTPDTENGLQKGHQTETSRTSDTSSHITALEYKASTIAENLLNRTYVERSIMVSTTLRMGDETPLIRAVDRVLEIDPDNPVYLFAKSEAFYACMDGEKGQAFREKTLEKAPNHFDARMRERHFGQWDGMYSYHAWDEEMTRVPEMVLAMQDEGMSVQIVRHGLELVNMVIIPASRASFPSNIVDYQWRPVWVDTPYGPVFEHYVMLKPKGGKILRNELSISPYPLEPVHQRNGDMLIQRFCETDHVFIVFNDGQDILFNKKYQYSTAAEAYMAGVKQKLPGVKPVADAGTRFQQAAQWYMNHSDLADISFDGSGAAKSYRKGKTPATAVGTKPRQSGMGLKTVSTDFIESKVIEIISDQFDITEEEIRAHKDTAFLDLGLDSLDGIELIMFLEEAFDMVIPDQDIEELVTVNKLVEYIVLHKG